jgi:hypothetical protein
MCIAFFLGLKSAKKNVTVSALLMERGFRDVVVG